MSLIYKPFAYDGDEQLLLHFDGANNSSIFIDSSSYNGTVFARGTSVISTDAAAYGGSSASFDGSSSAGITCGTAQKFIFNTDFIMSCLLKTNTTNASGIFQVQHSDGWGGGAMAFTLNRNESGEIDLYLADYGGSQFARTYPARQIAVNDGAWHYCALRREGNYWQIWIDGLQMAEGVYSGSISNVKLGNLNIGCNVLDGHYLNGYMDEVLFRRNTKTQVPCMWATFIVPTDAFTSDEYTSLLLHMDGSDDGITFNDSSSYGHTISVSGNAKTKTGTKVFGTASGNFDGTNSTIYTAKTADLELNTGDFTVECWANFTSMPTSDDIWSTNWSTHTELFGLGTPSGTDGLSLILGPRRIFIMSNDAEICSGYHHISTGAWHHFAMVRASNTLFIFIDGKVVATATNSGTLGSGSNFYVGSETGQGAWMNGYIDEVRVSKGIARYTSTFSIPPYPNKYGVLKLR